MSNTNLGTLNKIQYTNLAEFTDSINRNFAVIQNSPLFKGIPGNTVTGDTGNQGERGSKLFFIDFVKFNVQFPTEITLGSHIDMVFINTKLSTPNEKTKILLSLNTANLVDNDVFILTNSSILTYNYAENKLYDTGKSLNNSITNEIQEIIYNLFQSYLPQLQNSIKNVFENYTTLAKNYADTNNGGISSTINNTSVYSPFIPGVTSNIGIPVENHKYFGIGQNINTVDNDNTFVFGSIVKYYKMLMDTLNTDGSQTLTSDYAPGVNNIPSAIFMQDTYNNGLLFGYKGKTNLKTFGSIFKNDSDELEIKSDSGKLASDYSSLKIHKNHMRYDKLVQFQDSLEISHNLIVSGHINNQNIKTGDFSYNDNKDLFNNVYGVNTPIVKNNIISIGGSVGTEVIAGNVINESFLIAKSTQIYLKASKFKDKVLVTNSNGAIESKYSVENTTIVDQNTGNTWTPLQEITTGISQNKFISTYYYNYLVRKINRIFSQHIEGLYWTKEEFSTNVIPELRLSNNFSVDGSVAFSSMASFSNNQIYFNPASFRVLSPQVQFQPFSHKMLVGDDKGYLRKDIGIDLQKFNNDLWASNSITFPTLPIVENLYEVTTKYHYNRLINYLNAIGGHLTGNYYTKPDFNSFGIPKLNVSTGLFSKKFIAVGTELTSSSTDGDFRNDTLNTLFYSDTESLQNFFGGEQTGLYSNQTKIKGFGANQILGTRASKTGVNGTIAGIITPINMIGSLGSITTETYNSLNGQLERTLADNKTVASLILGITTNYNTLKNYIDNQLTILNQSLSIQIQTLAADVYSKINIINNQINNIHNELSIKADIEYVDEHVNNIFHNINGINQTLVAQQNEINILKQQMLTKVDKSVFEPWKAIVDDFMLNNVQFPKGGIILWEGKVIGGILQIAMPPNFEEVISMRGRAPIGWTNGIYDANFYGKFSVLGETGGTAMVGLTGQQNGPHTHTTTFGREKIGNGNGWFGFFFGGNNGYNDNVSTANSGNGTPHENTPPYKVIMYIRATKGI